MVFRHREDVLMCGEESIARSEVSLVSNERCWQEKENQMNFFLFDWMDWVVGFSEVVYVDLLASTDRVKFFLSYIVMIKWWGFDFGWKFRFVWNENKVEKVMSRWMVFWWFFAIRKTFWCRWTKVSIGVESVRCQMKGVGKRKKIRRIFFDWSCGLSCSVVGSGSCRPTRQYGEDQFFLSYIVMIKWW